LFSAEKWFSNQKNYRIKIGTNIGLRKYSSTVDARTYARNIWHKHYYGQTRRSKDKLSANFCTWKRATCIALLRFAADNGAPVTGLGYEISPLKCQAEQLNHPLLDALSKLK